MNAPSTPHLDRPLSSLAAWTQHFSRQAIPVLASSAQAVLALAERDAAGDDGVDAQLIVKGVGHDPLMALRILSHVALNRSSRREVQVETITEALVLMGVSPFFRAFSELPVLETLLQAQPEALQGAQEVLRRGHRAGQFALGFSVHRMDGDAPQVHQAAQLHDFAELLLWVHAPGLALDIQRLLREHEGLRSADAQRRVLGIELHDLQQALMHEWRLPELLIRLSDPRHAAHPSVRSVLLAIRVARHSAHSWENPALPDDIREVGELLQLSSEHARNLLIELDS
jgi:HD-like signal output (HDOD) protein